MIAEVRFALKIISYFTASSGRALISWGGTGSGLYDRNAITEVELIKAMTINNVLTTVNLTKPATSLSLGTDLILNKQLHLIDTEFNPSVPTKYYLNLLSGTTILHSGTISLDGSGKKSSQVTLGKSKFSVSSNIFNEKSGVSIKTKTCFLRSDSIKDFFISKSINGGAISVQGRAFVQVPFQIDDISALQFTHIKHRDGTITQTSSAPVDYQSMIDNIQNVVVRFSYGDTTVGTYHRINDEDLIASSVLSGSVVYIAGALSEIENPLEGIVYSRVSDSSYHMFERSSVNLPEQPYISEPDVFTKFYPSGYFSYDAVTKILEVPVDVTLTNPTDSVTIEIAIQDISGNLSSWSTPMVTTALSDYAGEGLLDSKYLYVDADSEPLDGSSLRYLVHYETMSGSLVTVLDRTTNRDSNRVDADKFTGGFDIGAFHPSKQSDQSVLTERDFVSGPGHLSLGVKISTDPSHVHLYKLRLASKEGCVTCQ